MTLPCGHYRTAAGSEMRISGKHCGISEVEFDWLEEGGCIDCEPSAYDVDGQLVWSCDECGGGDAELFPISAALLYHENHTTEQISEMCESAGTNYAYWRQIAYGHRQPSWQMAQRLAKASGYVMTTRELRPDIHGAMTESEP